MAKRGRSISTIEKEITTVMEKMEKAQALYDSLAERFIVLQKEKSDYESKQIIAAYKKSGRTYSEMMTFLEA